MMEDTTSLRESSPYMIGIDGIVPVCPRGFDCALVVSNNKKFPFPLNPQY